MSKRVLGKSLDSLMEQATAADRPSNAAQPGGDPAVAGAGLRQFVRVTVGPGTAATAPVSETASSPSIQPAAHAKRFGPAPLPWRRAPKSGLVPLGLLLADATILGLAFVLVNATPAPSVGRLVLCVTAIAVACVVGCLAVVSLEEEG